MRQILHLLVVDRNTTSALATWHGARWLLPMLTCAERVRSDPAVLRWVAERGVKGEVVGQWLGRVSPQATDWLVVIRALAQCSALDDASAWTPLARLTEAIPLIDYQGWAVSKSTDRGPGPSVPGPFGSCTWLEEVKAWIGASAGSVPHIVTPYRVSSHEVVIGADTDRGRVYFKGFTPERASEARLTEILSAIAPFSFARTVALDARPDRSVWWLTSGCPGESAGPKNEWSRSMNRGARRVIDQLGGPPHR